MATDPKLTERLRALWGDSPKQPTTNEPPPSRPISVSAPLRARGTEARGSASPIEVGTEPPRRCPWHVDRSHWKDEPAPGRPGFIRTTCRKCGTWIGDRPAERSSAKEFDLDSRI